MRRKSLQHFMVRTNSKPSVHEHPRLLQATTPHPAHKTQQLQIQHGACSQELFAKGCLLGVMRVLRPTFKNAQTAQSREPKWADGDLTKKPSTHRLKLPIPFHFACHRDVGNVDGRDLHRIARKGVGTSGRCSVSGNMSIQNKLTIALRVLFFS